jgi:hypothetical protein
MFSFSGEFSEIERAMRKLERFRDSTEEIAGREVVQQIREFAASGRAPDGSTWAPLTSAYRKAKMRAGFGGKANKKRTGEFLASIKLRNGIIAPDEQHMGQAQGLESKRVSFETSPITAGNVERQLKRSFDEQS